MESRPLTEEAVSSTVDKKIRRFLKHHLHQSNLGSEMRDKAANICTASDGWDIVWSLYNHYRHLKPYIDQIINGGEFERPPFVEYEKERLSEAKYFRRWLDQGSYPLWPFWPHIRSRWAVRHHPSVVLIQFDNLKRNEIAQATPIYPFLRKTSDVRAGTTEDIVRMARGRSTFSYVKNADKILPQFGRAGEGGAASLINKGTNGRWYDELPDELSNGDPR